MSAPSADRVARRESSECAGTSRRSPTLRLGLATDVRWHRTGFGAGHASWAPGLEHVIEKLRVRLTKAVELMETALEETLTY
jgi:hypothetical protein